MTIGKEGKEYFFVFRIQACQYAGSIFCIGKQPKKCFFPDKLENGGLSFSANPRENMAQIIDRFDDAGKSTRTYLFDEFCFVIFFGNIRKDFPEMLGISYNFGKAIPDFEEENKSVFIIEGS